MYLMLNWILRSRNWGNCLHELYCGVVLCHHWSLSGDREMFNGKIFSCRIQCVHQLSCWVILCHDWSLSGDGKLYRGNIFSRFGDSMYELF